MAEIKTRTRELPKALRPAQAAPVRRAADVTSHLAAEDLGCQASHTKKGSWLPFAGSDAE